MALELRGGRGGNVSIKNKQNFTLGQNRKKHSEVHGSRWKISKSFLQVMKAISANLKFISGITRPLPENQYRDLYGEADRQRGGLASDGSATTRMKEPVFLGCQRFYSSALRTTENSLS